MNGYKMSTNRMPEDETSQPFFQTPRDWSKIKIRILKKYLQPFCYKLGSAYKTIYFVDAFAGAGAYRDAGKTPGSPLEAARWSKQFQREGRPFKLKCIFVESDRKTFNELSANLEPYFGGEHVRILHGEFSEKLPEVLGLVGALPCLFFIDPFGVLHIDQPSLAPLSMREGKTEILIRVDTHYITRMLGQKVALTSDKTSVRKAAHTILERVSSIFGTDKTEWSDELHLKWHKLFQRTRDNTKAKYRAIMDIYEQALKRTFEYVISTPIRGNFHDNPQYYLTFCSRHSDAMILMADFMYKEEERCRIRMEIRKSNRCEQGRSNSAYLLVFFPAYRSLYSHWKDHHKYRRSDCPEALGQIP